MRFPILMSPLWRPLLLPFGATPDRSYLEIEDGVLHIRFGWLFNHRFPLSEVEGASPSHWPLWAGIGWRTNFAGVVGLVGTYVNIVEVRFKQPQRVRMFLPTRCRRLYVSVAQPQDFVGELHRATTAKSSREPVAAAGRSRRRKSG